MDDVIKIVGTRLVDIISNAIKSGKSRKEAEQEAAQAVERGDVVSSELYDRLSRYISETEDFENEG